eukprot:4104798-Prymnesium_polylepis.1
MYLPQTQTVTDPCLINHGSCENGAYVESSKTERSALWTSLVVVRGHGHVLVRPARPHGQRHAAATRARAGPPVRCVGERGRGSPGRARHRELERAQTKAHQGSAVPTVGMAAGPEASLRVDRSLPRAGRTPP